jgi:hypothetical protein
MRAWYFAFLQSRKMNLYVFPKRLYSIEDSCAVSHSVLSIPDAKETLERMTFHGNRFGVGERLDMGVFNTLRGQRPRSTAR